ncbi:hypothetical protein BS50DRAFT_284658 [Corynespora cassiicola Philippines]|uniref:Uncharacterized protein n=1 Tax=Corynespora cassiicola Philippines TaxID=1448308 RepID=A0A2T2P1I9_CORCC|nr:hypothetical protein BS50DRAFT_284658 [Corynespora cassiicola Philippines]
MAVHTLALFVHVVPWKELAIPRRQTKEHAYKLVRSSPRVKHIGLFGPHPPHRPDVGRAKEGAEGEVGVQYDGAVAGHCDSERGLLLARQPRAGGWIRRPLPGQFPRDGVPGAAPGAAAGQLGWQAEAYLTVKLFLALFGRELAARVDLRRVWVVLTTPGFCASNFFPHGSLLMCMVSLSSARYTDAGARLHVNAAAVAPAEHVHGRYLRDGAVLQVRRPLSFYHLPT